MSSNNKAKHYCKSGSTVVFQTSDCYNGNLKSEGDLFHLIDYSNINPATGPLYIENAEPGDVLRVDILELKLDSQGVMSVSPGRGALKDFVEEERTKIIKIEDEYYCMDFSSEEFEKIVNLLGSIESVYNLYYDTLIKAVNADLGEYKPKRIGHLNLVRKYNKKFPYDYSKNKKLEELVKLISEKEYELDYNVAGLFKEDCGEVYISGYLAELIKKYNVRVVLGSDSHSSKFIDKYKINI